VNLSLNPLTHRLKMRASEPDTGGSR
jgi:hypothetical protein